MRRESGGLRVPLHATPVRDPVVTDVYVARPAASWVLSDNGKQFTGRFGKPRAAEVLFERICRRNGIETILTKLRSPTTTGKVERFHQTLQADGFAHGPFRDVAAAQAAVDAFRFAYNHEQPHQALDDATPASRFVPVPESVRAELGLDIPAGRLYGARLAGMDRPVPAGPMRVQRRVSGRGVTQVAGQTLRVGFAHRHTLVDIDVHKTEFHIYDQAGELLAAVPRTSGKEVTRTKGYGVRDRIG
jgi:hypothetical protein